MQQVRYVRPHGNHKAGDLAEVPDGAKFASYLEAVQAPAAPAAVQPAVPAAPAAAKEGA